MRAPMRVPIGSLCGFFLGFFTCLEEKNTQGPQQGLNSDLVALLEK